MVRKNVYKLCSVVLIAMASLALGSCGIYSFSGVNIHPEVNTVSIEYFQNRASIVVPSLSQNMTEMLRDRFVSETNLDLIDRAGDLEFTGVISGYKVTNVAPKGNETSALSRLTITVNVEFINNVEEEKGWKKSFSRYAEFPSDRDLSSVQDDLIEEINLQLIQDIFNAAVVNW